MSSTLPRGRGPSPILRILKTNPTIRPHLPACGSALYIKNSPFSSHAVLSRLRTPGSANAGNIGVSRRPGCVNPITNMHRQCMQGVRLGSTLDEAGAEKQGVKQGLGEDEAVKAEDAEEEMDEAGTEKEGVKQGLAEDEAVKAEDAEEEMDEDTDDDFEEGPEEGPAIDWDKYVPKETEEHYKARFPAIHNIMVRRKTGQGHEDEHFKTYVTLQGRKHGWRKPRVWVSFSGDTLPEEVASLQWPTGKEGATKATVFDWEENQHDLRFKWPLGRRMRFQVTEKTLVRGDRRIWREVIQKGDVIVGDEKGEGD